MGVRRKAVQPRAGKGSNRHKRKKQRLFRARMQMKQPLQDGLGQRKRRTRQASICSSSEEILPDADMIDSDCLNGRLSDESSVDGNDGIDMVRTPRFTADIPRVERLPIKLNGQIVKQFLSCVESADLPLSSQREPCEEKCLGTEKNSVPFAEQLRVQQMEIREFKASVGAISMQIIRDPENEISLLASLVSQCKRVAASSKVKMSIIATAITEVFVNIAPAYRIRPLSNKEKASTVKKDTLKLRRFEETLVMQYKKFVDILRMQSSLRKASGKSLVELAFKCLCKLARRLAHFNCSDQLIDSLVAKLVSRDRTGATESMACLRELLQSDRDMVISGQIVQSLCKMIKRKHFKVQSNVIDLFLGLRMEQTKDDCADIREEVTKQKLHFREMTRRDRKRMKETTRLRKTLQQESIADRRIQLFRKNSAIVENVFHCYFRILRDPHHGSQTICSVLNGLTRFSHLINVDFHDSLLDALFDIACQNEKKDSLDVRVCPEVFRCLNAAGAIQQQHNTRFTLDTQIDNGRFLEILYRLLIGVTNGAIDCDDNALMLTSIKGLLVSQTRRLNRTRVWAFVKRLLTLSLNCSLDALTASIVLAVAQVLQNLSSFPECLFLTDKAGIYLESAGNPDFSNAQHCSFFETVEQRRHYASKVVQFNQCIRTADSHSDISTDIMDFYAAQNASERDFLSALDTPKSIRCSRRPRSALIHNDMLRRAASIVNEPGDFQRFH